MEHQSTPQALHANAGSTTNFPLDTDQFAANNKVKAQTVRKRFCETGSYFGIKPKKLMNGRLAWPDIQIEA